MMNLQWILTMPLVAGLLAPVPALAQQQRPVAMVSRDIPYARIVVADRPDHIGQVHAQWHMDGTRTTRYAAEFLQEYIERITGVQIPIISESIASYTQRPLILVGRSSLTDFVEEERVKLSPEGFIVRREGNRVAIVGEFTGAGAPPEHRHLDRGTLFGVYEFLEQQLGVRWYFAGELGVVIPERNPWILRDIDVTKAPAFAMRIGAMRDYLRAADEPAGPFDSVQPAIRQGNTTLFMSNHSCNDWHRYVEEHPEIFAVNAAGERVVDATGYGSNAHNHLNYLHPKVLEIDMQRLHDFYERGTRYWPLSIMPNSRYVRFFPKDLENIYHDQSPASQALWTPQRENSKLAEIIHGYTARFATRLGEEYPGKRLAFGAYSGFLKPPMTVEIPENADVMICTVKGNSLIVNPAYWQHNTEVVESWHKMLGEDRSRVYLWEYLCYPNHRLQLYPYTMQKWFQHVRPYVNGAFNNGFSNRREDMLDHYRLSEINGWFWHRLLWDPDMDVGAALQQMYSDLFGPASEPMGELLDLAIDAYENADWPPALNAGNVSFVNRWILYRRVYAAGFVEQARALLAAARDAAPADSIYARRVEYFGTAIEGELDAAAAFHANDGPPPTQEVPATENSRDLGMFFSDRAWEQLAAVELRGRRVGEDPQLPSPSLVHLRHDGEALLVAARLTIREPEVIRREGTFRDDPEILRDDHLAIDFDLRRTGNGGAPGLSSFYRIIVNANGQVADGTVIVPFVMENRHWSDWNALWNPEGIDVATDVQEHGWSAVVRVPLHIFPEMVREPRTSFGVQLTQQLTSGGPMERMLTWSPMFGEPYEYDLARMATVTLKE